MASTSATRAQRTEPWRSTTATVPVQRRGAEAASLAASVVSASAWAVGAAVDAVRHPATTVDRAQHLLGTLPMAWSSAKPIMTGHCDDWREQYAHTLGVQAYIHGFPWVHLPELRWRWLTNQDGSAEQPLCALNEFWHAKRPATPLQEFGRLPNADVLYSVAWLDLRRGPVVLSHPAMGKRYFSFQLISMDSDTFGYVGTRSTGTTAGAFAITGPDWHGELPDGVAPLASSPTPFALVLGRIVCTGAKDLPTVQRLQRDNMLTPLAELHTKRRPAERDVWAPGDPAEDPLAEWETMNRAMAENPPGSRRQALLDLLSTIGIGSGQDVHQLDEGTQRGLVRAAYEGRGLLQDVRIQRSASRSGWQFLPSTLGRASEHGDFVTRAAIQCALDTVAQPPEETAYLTCSLDSTGQPLTGTNHYTLRFAKAELPKLHHPGFWSLTLYDTDHKLADNPAHRYSVRSSALEYDDDGGLTLAIQKRRPSKTPVTNWLPCAADDFSLMLRAYLPQRDIIEQTWQPPTPDRA